MSVKEIKTTEEYKTLLESEKPMYIDFYAQWCGKCQLFEPQFEEFAD